MLQAVRFREPLSARDMLHRHPRPVVEIQICPDQTPAQAGTSLASALRARGSQASHSLVLNFVAQAGTGEQAVAATVALWHRAVAACPRVDDLEAFLGDSSLSSLINALPG